MTGLRVLAALCVLLVAAGVPLAGQDKDRQLVLAAGAGTMVAPFTPGELRRVYLGLPVVRDGVRIVPLRNLSDPVLHEVFLQKIMFMSAPAYERRLLATTLQSGRQRLPEYKTPGALVAALLATPGAVTYMWAETVRATPGLQAVQMLWHGPVE